jgi:ABC-type phosphate transport system substrate-binding protein
VSLTLRPARLLPRINPGLGSVAAADGIDLPADMTVMLTNSPNPTAYPIVGFTWLLVNQAQLDAAKSKQLVDMLTWMLNDGQTYAPLSPAAQAKALALVQTIAY